MSSVTSFKQACPSCGGQITIKSALVGKKISCPKCKKPFVAEEPEEESDAEPKAKKAAVAAKSKAAKPVKKSRPTKDEDEGDEAPAKPSKPGINRKWLLIGGAVAIVLLVGVIIIVSVLPGGGSTSGLGRGSNPNGGGGTPADSKPDGGGEPGKTEVVVENEPTNLLPNDTQVVFNIPVKKFIDSAIGGQIFFSAGAFRWEDFEARIGIPLGNIERIVMAGNKDHSQSFVVIRTKDPLNDGAWDKIKENLEVDPDSKKTVNAKDFYLGKVNFLNEFLANHIPLEGLKTKAAIHLRDKTTLVYGDEKTIESFLQSPPKDLVEEAPPLPDGTTPLGTEKGTEGSGAAATTEGTATQEGDKGKEGGKKPAGPKTYRTVKPALRKLIERVEEKKHPLVVFASEATKGSPVATIPYLQHLTPLDKVKMLAVSLDDEDQPTLTITAICGDTRVSKTAYLNVEKLLSEAAKGTLKDALGFEFTVKAAEFIDGQLVPLVKEPPTGTTGGEGGGTTGGEGGAKPEEKPEIPEIGTIDILRQDEVLTITVMVKHNASTIFDDRIAPQVSALRAEWEMNDVSRAAARLELLARKSGELPAYRGAYPRPPDSSRGFRAWPPDDRVSWMPAVLPYLGDGRYGILADKINTEKSWRDQENLRYGRVLIPHFLHPGVSPDRYFARVNGLDQPMPVTHFVGMAGVGPDAAYYPPNHPLAGIFGYDRQTKREDIKDGASNTILMIQTDPALAGPWVAGGGSTVRGTPFLQKGDKAVGQPGGFLSPPHGGKQGVWVIMADGSVRWLTEDISPQVFQALSTMAGGDNEAIGDLNVVAPKVDLSKVRFSGGGDGKDAPKPVPAAAKEAGKP